MSRTTVGTRPQDGERDASHAIVPITPNKDSIAVRTLFLLTATLAACASSPPALPAHLPLPGATATGVGMDYLLYDPRTRAVWVPAGDTGSVDVVDTATRKVTRIAGFATRASERDGKTRIVGPSSATLGAGVVYVGNRGDSSICAISDTALTKGTCATLGSPPDGIAFVATTGELWVGTPRETALQVLDGTSLAVRATIVLTARPEGFAVDPTRGHFLTNVDGATTAIDLATHQVAASWKVCDGEEPHGLRVDGPGALLFVACSARIEVRDLAHDAAPLATISTGAGIDDLDYDPATHTVYAGAAEAATLTIATVDAHGTVLATRTIPTAPGARNGVLDDAGRVYLASPRAGELLVVPTR